MFPQESDSQNNVEDGTQSQLEVQDDGAADVESTPKSEVPPSAQIVTPSTSEEAARNAHEPVSSYFGQHAVSDNTHDHQHSCTLPAHPPAAASVSASDATASGHFELPDATSSLPSPERPEPHSTQSSLSVTSTDTAKTITPTIEQGRPVYPDQRFEVLHNQRHPPIYLPPQLRRGISQPSFINTFSSAIASQHAGGAQTAANSPSVIAAGLFSPTGPPPASAVESTNLSTYASPFLHFTQTHIPKETHVADVDVDPVSGRKLINHYEIVDELGRGTHGKVKLGRDLESHDANRPTYVAIKIVERFSKRRKLGRLGTTEDKVKKEVAILKKARHPNIVALLEVIDDPTRKKVYIVLEWVERGEIDWRTKGPKEIAAIEARRYAREREDEKNGRVDERALAQDVAVFTEAQRRLARQQRRQMRAYRQMKRGAMESEAWSIEMAGDNESEESEEDRMSRVSSMTYHSDSMRLAVDQTGRRASRAHSPLHPSMDTSITGSPSRYLRLTSDPETMSPASIEPRDQEPSLWREPRRPSSAFSHTGLEGTMYGAYDPLYSQSSRVASLNSLASSRGSSYSVDINRIAAEILDSSIDSELEYVPVMTMEQIRIAFRDTLLGLQYLHYQNIIHRDIKPPNLLATIDNRVKISDFGVSYLGRPVHDGEAAEDVSEAEAQDHDEAKELAKTVGTPAFYAPELCITDPTEDPPPVTKAIDVWALGITLFCMLFARTPFVDNEFVVMRAIAEEDIYLPRKRLQPVDTKPKSRPSSHARGSQTRVATARRNELDLVYEEINDELHDLLERLLIKDPRKRITLEEVRHHPWVLAGIPDQMRWLEETDPSRQSEGKKIEISKEELNTAVVPLNLVERMRSGIKKVLGIGRTRGHSSASTDRGSPAPSAGSSGSTISQDARRQSIRGDESIFTALKASRESEHPLSKSVAASPELDVDRDLYFEKGAAMPNGSAEATSESTLTPSRPSPPHRAMTISSAAGSMRTVKQSDYRPGIAEESPPPSPGLPGTPLALASPGGSHLGGLLGGPSRLIKTVRERSSQRARQHRGVSSDGSSVRSSDPHSGASIAVSQATAEGHVDPPEALRNLTPASSAYNSPAASRPHSVTSEHREQQHLQASQPEPGLLSRLSSSSSLASISRHAEQVIRNTVRPATRQPRPNESSAEDWKRADSERVRKLVRESKEDAERERTSPTIFGLPTSWDGRDCPPSPDDHKSRRGDSTVSSIADTSNPDTSPDSMSPSHQNSQLPPPMVSSSSDLGSAVSMSISNPSIPSVISEASSVDANEGNSEYFDEEKLEPSSDDTLNPRVGSGLLERLSLEGYTPDQETALDSDPDEEYDSSSDSDGGLVMGRRKSQAKAGSGLIVGPPNAQKERRLTNLSRRSRKSSRSGSNNTMKKVGTRESAEGNGRRSMEISEE